MSLARCCQTPRAWNTQTHRAICAHDIPGVTRRAVTFGFAAAAADAERSLVSLGPLVGAAVVSAIWIASWMASTTSSSAAASATVSAAGSGACSDSASVVVWTRTVSSHPLPSVTATCVVVVLPSVGSLTTSSMTTGAADSAGFDLTRPEAMPAHDGPAGFAGAGAGAAAAWVAGADKAASMADTMAAAAAGSTSAEEEEGAAWPLTGGRTAPPPRPPLKAPRKAPPPRPPRKSAQGRKGISFELRWRCGECRMSCTHRRVLVLQSRVRRIRRVPGIR